MVILLPGAEVAAILGGSGFGGRAGTGAAAGASDRNWLARFAIVLTSAGAAIIFPLASFCLATARSPCLQTHSIQSLRHYAQ